MKKLNVYVLVFVTMLCGFGLTGCTSKVDLMTDMEVVFAGVEGDGDATVDFPHSDYGYGFVSDLITSGEIDVNTRSGFSKAASIESCVTYEVTPNEGLSNGDTVTVNINVDSKKLKSLGYSAKSTSKEFKVEGLKEAKKIDAFKDYTPKFEGESPNARVSDDSLNRVVDGVNVRYEFNHSYNLSIGQEIEVTAVNNSNEDVVFKDETKTYKVENVDAFLVKDTDITDETFESMKEESQTLRDEYEKKYMEQLVPFKYGTYEYVGYAFYGISDDTLKNIQEGTVNVTNGNACYMIYKQTALGDDGTSKDFYFCYKFMDIINRANGKQIIEYPASKLDSPHTVITLYKCNDNGYDSLDQLFDEIDHYHSDYQELQTDIDR